MIEVVPISLSHRGDVKNFVHLPWSIYQKDPLWVPPLIRERLEFLNPKKNPYFEHAEVQLFLALHNGRPVGRISAQIDHLHQQIHQDDVGFFGLFESVEDDYIAEALLASAETWLKSHGMKTVRGPFSLSINHESGLLVEGFQEAPMILTPHNPRYYPHLMGHAGYQKCKDLYCWSYDPTKPIPTPARQLAEEARHTPGLTLREVDPRHLKRDVRIIVEIFNAAWKGNWGFLPTTEAEQKKIVKDFRLILDPHVALIAEIHGEPAAICIALPNINELIKDFKGHLSPWGFLRLLYRLKTRQARSGRLLLLGIKEAYRSSFLNVLLFTEIHRRGRERGYRFGELSWTLEDNVKINTGIQMMGGTLYKTYRVYEKPLLG